VSESLFEEPVVAREYYSIGDVCDLTGLKPHVLRYWETQFEILNPSKNRAGNRIYRSREVELILLVKHLLYDKKFTIDGARQHLKELRKGGTLDEGRSRVVEPGILAGMREELERLLEILTPPGGPREPGSP
jgi:DNA-binding transcriptional MerR regulator